MVPKVKIGWWIGWKTMVTIIVRRHSEKHSTFVDCKEAFELIANPCQKNSPATPANAVTQRYSDAVVPSSSMQIRRCLQHVHLARLHDFLLVDTKVSICPKTPADVRFDAVLHTFDVLHHFRIHRYSPTWKLGDGSIEACRCLCELHTQMIESLLRRHATESTRQDRLWLTPSSCVPASQQNPYKEAEREAKMQPYLFHAVRKKIVLNQNPICS